MNKETIMPDGRPIFAWENEIEILRSEKEQVEKAKKEIVIFRKMCLLVYEHWQENITNDWRFRMKYSDTITTSNFYEALTKYLKLDN